MSRNDASARHAIVNRTRTTSRRGTTRIIAGRVAQARAWWHGPAVPAPAPPPVPPSDPGSRAGGAIIALGVVAGVIIGLVAGQPTAGALAGFGAGVGLAILLWLRDRRG